MALPPATSISTCSMSAKKSSRTSLNSGRSGPSVSLDYNPPERTGCTMYNRLRGGDRDVAKSLLRGGGRAARTRYGRQGTRAFEAAGFAELVRMRDLVAVKAHFGERGCTSFVSPALIRPVVDDVIAGGGRPFMTDTGCLYYSSRANARDHAI